MLKKWVASVLIVTLSLLCLPVFSSAANAKYYSPMPEPIPTDNVKYFVLQINSGYPSLYCISAIAPINVRLVIENGYLKVQCYTDIDDSYAVSSNCFRTAFNVNTGSCVSSTTEITSGVYTFSNFPIASNTLCVTSYGCNLGSGFNLPAVNVAWNDSTDPSTYTTILNNINSKLNEIDTNTDGIEAALADINSELELFYNLFNAYQSAILEDTTNIQTLLNTVITRLNSFASQNHTDLVNILNKLNQIYDLLNKEEPTRAPAIDNQDEVDNVLQNEAALNKDFSGDLNQQFDVAGNIFDNNSSFSFISNLFNDLILSVPQLNSLIIFSLAIGLCVLILGRRLNA